MTTMLERHTYGRPQGGSLRLDKPFRSEPGAFAAS
jgi:hypothetical protein